MTPKELLVQRSAQGDVGAWQELQATLEPEILAIARRNRLLRRKGLNLPDDLAEIRVATLERLAHEDFANLKDFLGRPEVKSFDSWVAGAVDFAIRAHVTNRYGRAPKVARGEAPRPQPSKRDLHSHAGRLDDEPERGFLRTLGMTARLTVAELFACIEHEFTADEARAMRLYYGEDREFGEIARELGLADAKAADLMIRKLNARLRYRVAKQRDSAESA